MPLAFDYYFDQLETSDKKSEIIFQLIHSAATQKQMQLCYNCSHVLSGTSKDQFIKNIIWRMSQFEPSTQEAWKNFVDTL